VAIEVRWGSATHVGCVRSSNQDATLAGPTVFAVADGMGGHAAGDVASTLAVGSLAKVDPGATPEDLIAAVRSANEVILEESSPGSGREGMGTTVTGLCLARSDDGDVVLVFNVGDSRTYRLAGGSFRQLTEDHSLVAEMVRDGELRAEDAATHPSRNVVTRALGIPGHLEVDQWSDPPVPGTTYLMCSDGLSNELGEAELQEVLSALDEPQAQADRLVALALEAGARDNVSVVVVTVDAVTDVAGDTDEDTNPRDVPTVVERAAPESDPGPAPEPIEVPGSAADRLAGPEPAAPVDAIGAVPGADVEATEPASATAVISDVPGLDALPEAAGMVDRPVDLVVDVPSPTDSGQPDDSG
jgi:protein phosphatase